MADSAAQVVIEIDAVGDYRHEGQSVTSGEGVVDVLAYRSVSISAGVGGVVPGTVVVYGPVEKLKVGVGANRVDIEKVWQTHASDVEFDAADGQFGGEGEWCAGRVGEFQREADDLVDLITGQVRFGAECGVTDDVQVGESGQSKGFGDTATAGRFHVEDGVGGEVRVAVELVAKVDGAEEGGFVLAAAEHAVGTEVGGVERGVALKDDVGLAEDEIGSLIGMGEHGRRGSIGGGGL